MSDKDLASKTLKSFQLRAGNAEQEQTDWCDEQQALFQIDNQGKWRYLESPLPVKFARLFSSILKCVDGVYQLVTPIERVLVDVDSFPLVVVDYEKSGNVFKVTTSLDTEFVVDEQAINCLDESIVCNLPNGLSAKFNRGSYYRFINDFILDES